MPTATWTVNTAIVTVTTVTQVANANGLSADELAARAGVSVRTVRYYQSEGLLPAPARQGREARYDALHLERLRLINELRDRGLRLSTIAEILRQSPDAETALDWLGLRDVLQKPWSEDRAALLNESELSARLAGTPENTCEALVRTGVIERRADATPVVYFVPSPGMLDVAVATLRLGLDADTAARLRDLLQARLRDMATELVARFTDEVSLEQLAGEGPGALAKVLDQLQPLTRQAVDLLFAHEMERAQRELVDAAENTGGTE